jgi:hypothetical protein
VARLVVAAAAELNTRLGEVTRSMRVVLAREIAELDGDRRLVELLGASIEGNVETILHILQHDIPAEHVEAPPAAVEYARRLAQRGIPANSLVRAYRLGQDHLLKASFAQIHSMASDPGVAFHAARRFVEVTFTYIDWVSQQVVTAYEAEREQWLANRNTVRAIRIREIIEGQDIDLPTAEAALGHQLRQHHLGAIVWLPDGVGAAASAGGLAHLEQVMAAVGRGIGRAAGRAGPDVGRPLFSAADTSSGWVWFPLGSRNEAVDVDAVAEVLSSLDPPAPDLRIAFGGVAAGIDGFRATHRQAQLAQGVAMVAAEAGAGPGGRVIAYTQPEVAAAGLLATDLEQARMLVRGTLGALATDDPPRARLRATLLAFLSTACNYTATAELLTMHKNSVKYRISRAEEERGVPIGDDRLEVELALVACRWFGPEVLLPPSTP